MNRNTTKLQYCLSVLAAICALSFTNSVFAAGSWKKGDRIFGQSADGKWYPGSIAGFSSNYYKVRYDANSNIVNAKKIAPYTWKRGSKVHCTMEGAGGGYFKGEIVAIHEYNVFQVSFSRSQVQYRRSSSCIFAGTPARIVDKSVPQYNAPPPPKAMSRKFYPGGAVLAYYQGFWYPASITAMRVNDYSVTFSGGYKSNLKESYLSPIVWKQGSHVQCNSKTDPTKKYYNAQVEAINNRDIWVIYSNNARETLIHGKCRSK